MTGPTFGLRAVLGLVVVGSLAFVAMLYAIGAGLTGGGNDGGSHALGRGLNGFSALAAMAGKVGYDVTTVRDPGRLDDPGLLILTPPFDAKGAEIARVVAARRKVGPTLVVTPKWIAMPAGNQGKPGWTHLARAAPPTWQGFADDVSVSLASGKRWRAGGRGGALAAPRTVQSGRGPGLVPLATAEDGRILAAFRSDAGYYPRLNHFAGAPVDAGGEDPELYPLIFVFEPDLLDNYGLADRETALFVLGLLREASDGGRLPIVFDVTFNGLGRGRNLLTLAFAPPFLAATIALLLAALAAGWRAFVRFGPPRLAARPIAFGKTALVENSAGLIRRTGRIRLLGPPYAALVQQRSMRALGLPPASGAEAIDAAQARRGGDGTRFSAIREALAAARKPHELLRQASALYAIERTFSR